MPANYTLNGSGVVRVGGCGAIHILEEIYETDLEAGEVGYDRFYAEKGRLVKRAVKKVLVKKVNGSVYSPVILYLDNENTLYNEVDLLTQSEAEVIADRALAARILAANRKARQC